MVGGVRGRTKFYSEPCTLKVDAIEDVCSHAVEWMIRECCVQVVDLSYHRMKELEGKVGVMENLVSMYCDNADASKAKEETVRRRYAALFTEAQRVLKKYDDVVPADRGPATRTEQLVCELAVLIAKGDAMAAAPAEMVSPNLGLLYYWHFIYSVFTKLWPFFTFVGICYRADLNGCKLMSLWRWVAIGR